MPRDEKPSAAESYGQGYAYFAMALSFVVAILLFGAAGWVVDGKLHTRPLLAILGAFLGGFAAFMRIYYRVKAETRTGDRGSGTGGTG
ncbi:MAG TPA: AtpZ/AtpI family protein [Gemmatimonadales bacterium]